MNSTILLTIDSFRSRFCSWGILNAIFSTIFDRNYSKCASLFLKNIKMCKSLPWLFSYSTIYYSQIRFFDFPVQGYHRMGWILQNLFAIMNAVQQPYASYEWYSVWHFMTFIQQSFQSKSNIGGCFEKKRSENIAIAIIWIIRNPEVENNKINHVPCHRFNFSHGNGHVRW